MFAKMLDSASNSTKDLTLVFLLFNPYGI